MSQLYPVSPHLSLDNLLPIKPFSLGKVISPLIRKEPQQLSTAIPLNCEIAVVMRMPKRPNFDFVTLEACLVGQVCGEGTRNGAPNMPGINCTNVQRRDPVREGHDRDIRALQFGNLRIELSEIPLVRLVVHVDVPVARLEKVVEPEAHGHFSCGWDGRKEAAAQDDDARSQQPKSGMIEQGKLSQ